MGRPSDAFRRRSSSTTSSAYNGRRDPVCAGLRGADLRGGASRRGDHAQVRRCVSAHGDGREAGGAAGRILDRGDVGGRRRSGRRGVSFSQGRLGFLYGQGRGQTGGLQLVRRWAPLDEAGAGPDRISLERREADLVLSYRGGRAKARLQPAPAARAAELARALAPVPAPADACRRAEACCKKAMPLMGAQCDVAFQLGDRSTATCTNSVKGMQMLLADQKIPIPPECR